jgi:hypothetical protein
MLGRAWTPGQGAILEGLLLELYPKIHLKGINRVRLQWEELLILSIIWGFGEPPADCLHNRGYRNNSYYSSSLFTPWATGQGQQSMNSSPSCTYTWTGVPEKNIMLRPPWLSGHNHHHTLSQEWSRFFSNKAWWCRHSTHQQPICQCRLALLWAGQYAQSLETQWHGWGLLELSFYVPWLQAGPYKPNSGCKWKLLNPHLTIQTLILYYSP